MKKLFSPFLLFASVAMAQEVPGYHPQEGYAYEDFGKKKEYAHLEWTSQAPKVVMIDSLSEDAISCFHPYRQFSYSITRKPNQNKGLVKVNQPYSEYNSFGITFGENKKGNPKVLDLSHGNADLSFTVKNTSIYTLNLYASLVDSKGKIVDAVGPHQDYNAYLDFTIAWNIAPGEERTLFFDYNEDAFDAQFNDSLTTCGPANFSGVDLSFNKKKVAGALFTVVNAETAREFDAYKSYPLIDASLEFSEIKIGRRTAAILRSEVMTDLDEADQTKASMISVYPNPVKGTLYFSSPLQDVVLLDMAGNTVVQVSSTMQLDVRNYPKGIYILKSTSLQRPCKIVVE